VYIYTSIYPIFSKGSESIGRVPNSLNPSALAHFFWLLLLAPIFFFFFTFDYFVSFSTGAQRTHKKTKQKKKKKKKKIINNNKRSENIDKTEKNVVLNDTSCASIREEK
jgi:predicted membrane protein